MPLYHWSGGLLRQVGAPPPLVTATTNGSYTAAAGGGGLAYDWSDTNLPWAYSDTSQFTATWPAGVTIVDLPTGSTDFYTNLKAACNAASGRIVVRLPAGVFRLNQFRMIGSSGSQTYAFGFWDPKLQGLLGQGPDLTTVEMQANSYTTAQVDALKTMTGTLPAAQPLQAGFMRLDGLASNSPVLLAGITFRGADQQLLTSVQPDVPAVVPQTAPYNGLVLYPGTYSQVAFCRFRASGHAMTSSPPFETGNAGSQRGVSVWSNCEFDGRLAPELNASRPRRAGMVMGNNEVSMEHRDCWMHHSKVSRYAVNDENTTVTTPVGFYKLLRVKAEQITNTRGEGLSGYTNAALWGFESVNGTVVVQDCIGNMDNPIANEPSRGISQHLQFTSVGARNPQGGRLQVIGGQFHSAFPSLEGFLCMRVTNTYWFSDGLANTMDVRDAPGGLRKTAYVVGGTWPPTAAALAAAGVTPATHYIVRNS